MYLFINIDIIAPWSESSLILHTKRWSCKSGESMDIIILYEAINMIKKKPWNHIWSACLST